MGIYLLQPVSQMYIFCPMSQKTFSCGSYIYFVTVKTSILFISSVRIVSFMKFFFLRFAFISLHLLFSHKCREQIQIKKSKLEKIGCSSCSLSKRNCGLSLLGFWTVGFGQPSQCCNRYSCCRRNIEQKICFNSAYILKPYLDFVLPYFALSQFCKMKGSIKHILKCGYTHAETTRIQETHVQTK